MLTLLIFRLIRWFTTPSNRTMATLFAAVTLTVIWLPTVIRDVTCTSFAA
jgi:hypothetical protein